MCDEWLFECGEKVVIQVDQIGVNWFDVGDLQWWWFDRVYLFDYSCQIVCVCCSWVVCGYVGQCEYLVCIVCVVLDQFVVIFVELLKYVWVDCFVLILELFDWCIVGCQYCICCICVGIELCFVLQKG